MPDVDGEVEEDPEDPEPKERGTEAIERRIEKLVQELRESGAVDVNDEVEFGMRKVRLRLNRLQDVLDRDLFFTVFWGVGCTVMMGAWTDDDCP